MEKDNLVRKATYAGIVGFINGLCAKQIHLFIPEFMQITNVCISQMQLSCIIAEAIRKPDFIM